MEGRIECLGMKVGMSAFQRERAGGLPAGWSVDRWVVGSGTAPIDPKWRIVALIFTSAAGLADDSFSDCAASVVPERRSHACCAFAAQQMEGHSQVSSERH